MRELTHDHRELSGLLVAIHEALQRVARGHSKLDDELHEIRDGIEAFREALLEHFAREQEALLPFVVVRLPEYQTRADGLITEHDRIAAMLTTVVHALGAVDDHPHGSGERRASADPESALETWRAELARFEELYVGHTKTEIVFLEDVSRSLRADAAATEQLQALLEKG